MPLAHPCWHSNGATCAFLCDSQSVIHFSAIFTRHSVDWMSLLACVTNMSNVRCNLNAISCELFVVRKCLLIGANTRLQQPQQQHLCGLYLHVSCCCCFFFRFMAMRLICRLLYFSICCVCLSAFSHESWLFVIHDFFLSLSLINLATLPHSFLALIWFLVAYRHNIFDNCESYAFAYTRNRRNCLS